MNEPIIRPIHSPEEVFQFLQDATEQRRKDIQIEDLVNHITYNQFWN